VLFDPEDGDYINLRNVDISPNYMMEAMFFTFTDVRTSILKKCLLPSARCKHKCYMYEITGRPTAR
jgi:hypothetical protein